MTAKKNAMPKATPKKKAATKRRPAKSKAKRTSAPKPGTTITRSFKGKQITVKVTDNGFVYRGKTYKSLTALTIHITGYGAVSGPRFFGLVGARAKGGSQ